MAIDMILDRDADGYFAWAGEMDADGSVGRELITARYTKKKTAVDSLRFMANKQGWELPGAFEDRTAGDGA